MRTLNPTTEDDVKTGDDVKPSAGASGVGMAGLAKGIAVLEAFGAARKPLNISEAARLTGISKPAVRRCLHTLTDLGYLRFDGVRFAPTRRVMRLGSAYVDTDPLNLIAQPYLDTLRDRLEESVALTIWDEGETVIIARADADRLLSLRGPVGRRMPGYCTASGRIFMAAMSSEELAATLAAHPPRAHTGRTVTDPSQIARAVDEVRKQGWARVDGEIEIGFLVVAVPITNARGETVAALSVNSNSQRVSAAQAVREFLPPLLETAEQISQLI